MKAKAGMFQTLAVRWRVASNVVSQEKGRKPNTRACKRPNWEAPMKLPRRQFLNLAAGAAAVPAMSRIARAQAYPTRPVRMV
jgi:hypothetical protein